MDRDCSPFPVPLLAFLVVTLLGMLVSVTVSLLEEEARQINESMLRYTHSMLSDNRKRRCQDDDLSIRKRTFIYWECICAYNCIMEDYLGPIPRFNQDSFQRIFHVSQKNYDQIRQLVCVHNSFFHDSIDCTLQHSICVDAKVLVALKYLAYGTAINAFRDYFQMGESTARLCVTNFATTLLCCKVITEKYLRKMIPSDARRVEKLHSEVHGVRGMVFQLTVVISSGGSVP
jgi:hypothetical protein